MDEVEFNDQSPPKIKAMFSAEKEKVGFINLLDPNNKNVEDWMGELEDMMK
jgi:dynein heavy chain